MRFKHALLPVLSVLFLLFQSPVHAATAEPTSSAMQWLMLIDEGKYAESWGDASSIFRAAINARAWEDRTRLYRGVVGRIVFRDVEEVSTVARLPNMPKGQYAVVRYHSTFEHKQDATETVSLVYEEGLWRVVSYSIK